MAQDFHAAFGVGEDNKHITTVDEDGVALAAIQGLNQKLNEKDQQIQDLKRQNDSLAKRLNHLESVVRITRRTGNEAHMKKIILLLGLMVPLAGLAQQYSIDWYKIAGGGGTSTGGTYSVSGTIGQPDASGPMTGGNYSLTGGFWA